MSWLFWLCDVFVSFLSGFDRILIQHLYTPPVTVWPEPSTLELLVKEWPDRDAPDCHCEKVLENDVSDCSLPGLGFGVNLSQSAPVCSTLHDASRMSLSCRVLAQNSLETLRDVFLLLRPPWLENVVVLGEPAPLRIDVVMFALDASLGSEAGALRTTRIIRSLSLGCSSLCQKMQLGCRVRHFWFLASQETIEIAEAGASRTGEHGPQVLNNFGLSKGQVAIQHHAVASGIDVNCGWHSCLQGCSALASSGPFSK